jgi:hypothetical protein
VIARFTAALMAVALTAAPMVHADTPAPLQVLNSLNVKPAASMDGYSRDRFGAPWTDDNDDPLGHNHCDTRDDILARDLTDTVRHGCKVMSGLLISPYTGEPVEFKRGVKTSGAVQIDHIVPLADAWRTGAQNLSESMRIDLANDPENLIAVDGPSNDRKGDQDASQWLPPETSFQCAYVERQIDVKAQYRLWVTQPEHDAIARILSNCK